MSRMHFAAVAGILLALALAGFAEDAAKELAKIESQLKKKPDDPLLNYRKAQFQMKLEKYEEGYASAQKAMEKFIKAGDDLAWLLLESVDLKNVAVDIHFNMGPKERSRPQMGIVRPLSFRIWKKGPKGERTEILEIIDFEIGMIDGKAETAALGITKDGHKNLGMLKPDMGYKDIRTQALELIRKRHPETEEKPPDEEKKEK